MNRKLFLAIGSVSAVAAPIAAVISCNNESYAVTSIFDKAPKFEGTKDAKHKIGAIVSDPENPRWQKSRKMLEENGGSAFQSILTAIQKSAADQKTWMDANASKYDALIIGATDNSVSGSWASFGQDKPVIAFDRLVLTNERTAYNWYVTYDNSRVGRMQGISIINSLYNKTWTANNTDDEIIAYIKANNLKEKSTILTLGGDPADNNAGLFFNGAMDLFKKIITEDANFNVPAFYREFNNVAQANWDYNKAQLFLNTRITSMKDRDTIKAILSPNDGMATSSINALNSNGLDPKKVYITGQDSNDSAILSIKGDKNPGQDMTISKPDSLGTAVTVSLMKVLLSDPAKYNVASITEAIAKEIINKIKADFPELSSKYNVDIKFDSTSYETSAGNFINSLLLTPKVIDSGNIDTFFTVTK